MPLLKLWIVLLFSFVATLANGQGTEYNDVVYLKNGSIFRGKILEYKPGESLTIELYGANTLTIEAEDIDRVVQGVRPPRGLDARSLEEGEIGRRTRTGDLPPLRNSGLYSNTGLGFLTATGDAGLAVGITVHTSLGYQFNKFFALGAGIGYDGYRPSRGENLIPIYGEVRLMPVPKLPNLFALGIAGYGLAQTSSALNVTRAEGGFLLHGGIGYRFQTIDQSEIILEFGTRFQNAMFVRELNTGDIETRDLRYARGMMRISMTFWGR